MEVERRFAGASRASGASKRFPDGRDENGAWKGLEDRDQVQDEAQLANSRPNLSRPHRASHPSRRPRATVRGEWETPRLWHSNKGRGGPGLCAVPRTVRFRWCSSLMPPMAFLPAPPPAEQAPLTCAPEYLRKTEEGGFTTVTFLPSMIGIGLSHPRSLRPRLAQTSPHTH